MKNTLNALALTMMVAALASCSGDKAVTSNISFFATASSDSYKHENYMPFMSTDGEADEHGWESELTGSWNAGEGLFRNEEGRSTWLQLAFPNPTEANGATIYWDAKVSDKNVYCLEYSKDGEFWTEVPSVSCSREKAEVRGKAALVDQISFKPVKANLFRVRIEAGNDSTGFGRIREFELMGDLRQFDTIVSVSRTLKGEVKDFTPLKTVDNPSDPWHLDLPKPAAGVIADGIYYSGPGLENDADGNLDYSSQMQIISEVSAEDFQNYVDELVKAGYSEIAKTCLEKNIHAQLAGPDKTVYAYYTDSEGCMRVICENTVVTQDEFSFKSEASGKTGIYQFAFHYGKNTHNTMDCGMLYALLPGDGSVMVMDACHIYQTSEETYREIYDFLRDITGTPEGEKIRISNWFITHSHSDHLAGASGFLRRFHDKVDVERVMLNFPAFSVRPASTPYASEFRHTLRTYFPDAAYIRPHTGMHLDMADMAIDVMYTHEDAVTAEAPAKYPLRDFNCTSTVLKVSMGGRTAILFGDTNVEAEAIITRNYTSDSWKADLVQVAHHCINYLDILYPWCQAPVILVPCGVNNAYSEKNFKKLQGALKYATDGAYFESEATYGVCPSENGFVQCYERPLVGNVYYDGTGI